MAEPPNTSRQPNEALLRYLAGGLSTQPEVESTALFPQNRQESLVVYLASEYYPERVDEAFLELRVYTNGQFHVTYVERYLGNVRRCRWDRHEQDHNARDHFHPLSNAETAGAVDRDFPADVTTLLETVVLPWVEDRLGTIWEE